MRLIDSDEFIKELSQLYAYAGWDKRDIHFSLSDIACNLEMMPVINVVLDFQAETPKHGHWRDSRDTGVLFMECSVCKARAKKYAYLGAVGTNGIRFCPYCGAKMDEVKP